MSENDPTGLRSRLDAAKEVVRNRSVIVPDLAIVLGSGLGDLADQVEDATRISYSDIPGLPSVGIRGHAGEMVLGNLGGRSVAILSGRVHFYEGHPADQVVFGVRLCGWLGAKAVLLTNAAGGIRDGMAPGDLMVITDQIHNFSGCNPLRGLNPDWLGPRFPDMTEIYDSELRGILLAVGETQGVSLLEGVYAGLTGPNYESPAEIGMLATIGVDAVGMSTTAEAIAARHMGMKVVGLSCIANLASGLSNTPLSHEDVKAVALEVGGSIQRLVSGFVDSFPLEVVS